MLRRVLTAPAVLLATALLLGLLAFPAAGDTPSPDPTLSPTPTPSLTPTDSVTPTDPTQPTAPPVEPTTPAAGPTSATTASSTPVSPLPTVTRSVRPSPTPSPSRSTPAPTVTLAPVPPASATDNVSITSAIIAFIVLVLTGLLLGELITGAPDAAPADQVPGRLDRASESDALRLLSTAGDALVEAGFDVSDVQSDLRQIAMAQGLGGVEILVMPTMVVVSSGQAGRAGELRTSVVATGDRQLRLHQIEALDDVVTRSREGLDPREAMRLIERIRALPPPFPAPVQLLGGVLATMGLAVLLGSSWRGMVLSGALGVLTGALGLLAQRIPLRYQALVTVTAAATVSLAVFLLARLGWSADLVPSLIAPLITLLPGALLTTGVIELASGQMISGAGRIAAGAMQLMLLALGIVAPALLVGVPALELVANKPALGTLGPWLAVAAFGVGIVVNRCARPRSMGWILIVLYAAYGAQVLGGLFLGGMLSAFVGAVAMTPVADLVARQRGGPPAIVSFTPAFWILVPGALGLMGVAGLLGGDGAGTQTLLTTVVTMVSVALGVLVGRAVSTLVKLRRIGPA